MTSSNHRLAYGELIAVVLVGSLVAAAILAIGCLAPQEKSMGDAQRIVYMHVAVAWVGLMGLIGAALAGLGYLLRRNLAWDHWAQASAEIGWLCASLTLLSGSLWAHSAWGTWWTWEPRLTTAFILWAIYSGYLAVRGNIDDSHQRARLASVVAIIGALDVPLVVMATRLFRGMHPVSPQMEPTMRLVLLLSVVSFSAFFVCLLVVRCRQIRLSQEMLALEFRVHGDSA